MANKRDLKKLIHSVNEELFVDAVAMSLYGPDTLKNNAETLLHCIVNMERNYISRISHPEPGMKARDYYKDLWEKFSAQVSEVVDQLNG